MTASASRWASLDLADARVPATIVTGFLGSGKTTLLNHIVRANTGRRIALVVNELGDVGIDGDLIARTDGDDILELTNGCICCSIRGDLIAGLRRLMRRPQPPEYLIIETSGIAYPLPVAAAFFLPGIQNHVRRDGIITLVDAEQYPRQADAVDVASAQVEMANTVLLNKTDLVAPPAAAAVEAALRRANPSAPILRTQHGAVDLRLLLDTDAFRVEDYYLDPAQAWEEEAAPTYAGDVGAYARVQRDALHTRIRRVLSPETPGSTAAPQIHNPHTHLYDEGIAAVSFVTDVPIDGNCLEDFWAGLPPTIFRGKGVVQFAGSDARCIFHQVGARILVEEQRPWEAGEARESRFVFIGKDFDAAALHTQLTACLVGEG